jgi:hypothetical protein
MEFSMIDIQTYLNAVCQTYRNADAAAIGLVWASYTAEAGVIESSIACAGIAGFSTNGQSHCNPGFVHKKFPCENRPVPRNDKVCASLLKSSSRS